MDAYLVKPVSIERLRATLERWLPIQAESSVGNRRDQREPTTAIDRNVLGAWLGEDHAAIDALLAKFRETALEAEREIDVASRTGDFAKLAAAAHKLRGPRRRLVQLALVPPPPRWSRRARPATAMDALNYSVRWQRICVLQLFAIEFNSTRPPSE
jgi:hypothetical protein